MSEDSLRIEIKSKSFPKSKKTDFEKIIKKYTSDDGNKLEIKYSRQRAIYSIDFFSLDEESIGQLLGELEKAGASDVIAIGWFDNVGEEVIYKRIKNKLMQFSSSQELEDWLKEINSPKTELKFDYGKEREDQTALIRLDINAKSKREKIKELFKLLLNNSEESYANFCSSFEAMVNSKTHDVKWFAAKWKEHEEWYESDLSGEFIKNVKFVFDGENEVYVGIDIADINLATDDWLEKVDGIAALIHWLDGVKKVWIKIRPGRMEREIFTCYPNPWGQEFYAQRRKITAENEWG